MTDSQKFTLIETVKKDIQKMGIDIEIFHKSSIKLNSTSFIVVWLSNGFFQVLNKKNDCMNQIEWENYSAEIDNLDRAILWINTQLKSIVFES